MNPAKLSKPECVGLRGRMQPGRKWRKASGARSRRAEQVEREVTGDTRVVLSDG